MNTIHKQLNLSEQEIKDRGELGHHNSAPASGGFGMYAQRAVVIQVHLLTRIQEAKRLSHLMG